MEQLNAIENASEFEDLFRDLRRSSSGAPPEIRDLVQQIVAHPVVEQLRPGNVDLSSISRRQPVTVRSAPPRDLQRVPTTTIQEEMVRSFTPTAGFRRRARPGPAAAAGSAAMAI
jgi:hypothetical protein